MRPRPWGWNPAGRRRWAIFLLLAGHLAWVLVGRTPSQQLSHALDALSGPGRSLSGRLASWREARRQRAADLDQARQEIQQLRTQVEALQTESLRNGPRVAEADEALRVLGLHRLMPLPTTGARVIANLRRAPFGGLVLDRGWDLGLVPDQGVLCPEGVVGRIWSVGPDQASVLPLDAYNASTGVMLARSRATGVLQGTGPGRAEIRYVGAQEVVQVGEPVFTSGLDRVFPRGLLVGHVTAVRPRDTELFLQVALAAPLDRVHLVLILPPKPPMQVQPPAEPPVVVPKRGKG
jgi:rod shape-determining protein MreC